MVEWSEGIEGVSMNRFTYGFEGQAISDPDMTLLHQELSEIFASKALRQKLELKSLSGKEFSDVIVEPPAGLLQAAPNLYAINLAQHNIPHEGFLRVLQSIRSV